MDFGLFGSKYRNLTLAAALDEAARVAGQCRRFGGALVLLQHLARPTPEVDQFFDSVIAEIA